jgi:transcriptional regulator with XRE-family HTH domain
MYRLKVKEIAQQKGISQRKLFLRSEVDIQIIRRIFRNPQTVVTTATLDKLAVVLGVNISELIESIYGEPPEPPEKPS